VSTDLTQQQQGLLERYYRALAAWHMAVNLEDDAELGTAYAAALDACLDAGFDPFHHPANTTKQEDYDR
jgi:16S rRNA G527 N7-methylase RsmG